MARIEAVERVAYAVACDGIGCEVVIPVRNAKSKAPGFYITIERVSAHRKDPQNNTDKSNLLFFHDKDCLLHSLEWGMSAYYNGQGGEPI